MVGDDELSAAIVQYPWTRSESTDYEEKKHSRRINVREIQWTINHFSVCTSSPASSLGIKPPIAKLRCMMTNRNILYY